ncbi:MAG: TrkH family potassium uptake protein, partial [Ruminococcus sp.]|nr:TrkH family potassium uptake protein [Ruminococcus sp.]
MNYSIIIYILGWIMNVEAVCMLVPGITALIYREKSGIAFLITILACLAIGVPLVSRKPSKKAFYAREGLVTTALSWIVLSIVGAVPFVLSGAIPDPIDAFFEIVSGFTTTGSSILSDPTQMPYCINIWRCFSHWIGGMGVLVFILTLLPLSGGYHMNLMKAESPGPSVGKLLPKVQSTAKILYKIYIALTVALIILLLLGGIPLYDSLCAAFGTAGTGGFGIKSDSMGSYSLYVQIVITIFMILFGVNFNVYFLLLTRKFSQALKSEEVRCYFFVIIASALMITLNVRHLFDNVWEALQQAFFQVGSIITTTGYATVDFNTWPTFSKAILVALMFIGGCAGSTAGGIKVARVVILQKVSVSEMRRMLHPNAVPAIQFEGKPLNERM